MVRESYVAGQFYPKDPGDLHEKLDRFIPDIGPERKKEVIGAIVPHAGYLYSGEVAGKVYAMMKPRNTFVLLGPNHTGMGKRFSLSTEDWRTPLGDMKVDRELARAVIANTELVVEDASAHLREHSIEVQLPFLKKLFPDTVVVPIAVSYGSVHELRSIGNAIAEAVKSTGKEVCVIASSDMSHYETRDEASDKDKKAIEAVLALDAERLVETVEFNDISMCGWAPAAVMLFATEFLGASTAELVEYRDSGDVSGDTAQVVGYAGILIS